jgi:hypothetical protein
MLVGMAPPFVFITSHRIKPGAADRFRELQAEYFALVEAGEPRLLAHAAYASADGAEVSLVQVHADADSAEHHLALVAPTLLQAADLVENVAIEVYGEPGPGVRAALHHNASAGVAVRVVPDGGAGFTRLAAAR